MRKPFGLCCCGELEACTECSIPSEADLTAVTCKFPTPLITGITNASCSGSYDPAADVTYSWTQNQYTPDEFGETVRLRKRSSLSETGYGYVPSAGLCQWLWNDPTIYQFVYHHGWYDLCDGQPPSVPQNLRAYYPPTMDVTSYAPVNSSDASSPWNRVLIPNTDPRIGTCLSVPPCCQSTSQNYRWLSRDAVVGSKIVLYVARGKPPGTVNSHVSCRPDRPLIFSASNTSDSILFWVLKVYQEVQRSYLVNATALLSNGTINQFGNAYPPAALNVPAVECGGWDNTTAGATGFTNGHLTAVSEATYAKPVNCDQDFDGNPIVLDFDLLTSECSSSGVVIPPSLPTTMEIYIDGL